MQSTIKYFYCALEKEKVNKALGMFLRKFQSLYCTKKNKVICQNTPNKFYKNYFIT